jgi:hypothetical protein
MFIYLNSDKKKRCPTTGVYNAALLFVLTAVCLLPANVCAQSKVSQDYWNIKTPLTPYRRPPPPVGYEPERIDLNGDGKPNTFIRCESGDQRATNNEIAAMFWEQSFGIRSELAISDTHIGLLNHDSLHDYRNFLNACNSLAAYSGYDDTKFCEKIGITDSNGLLTYAGLLTFWKMEIIHRHVPTFWMDLVEIPDNSV